MKKRVIPLTPFMVKVDTMMKNDPWLNTIKSQTKAEILRSIEESGVVKDGKFTASYKRKFKKSRAPHS